MAASSSSSASGNKRRASAYGGISRSWWTYDVFLSFRGEDTRNNFTDHLYDALHRNGIITFKDDERLKRGTEISSELTKAIEVSRFSIVIFSKDYASSTWCLEELSKIVEFSKTNNNHIVIPVFYNVDPSNVRKQEGKFKKAFDKHQQNPKIDSDKIQRWRAALERAANIAGYFISAGRSEAKLLNNIVKDIRRRLHISSVDWNQIVGMDYHWKKMNKLLEVESDDVRFIGIYGMGGIGKTTIARYVYEKLSLPNDYEVTCFLGDVRQLYESSPGRVVALQEKLLSLVTNETSFHVPNFYDGNNSIRKLLGSKKVLLVLDDVDNLDQLNTLAGQDWFGPKSRIIVTTRDETVLKRPDAITYIYKVDGLNHVDALQLFCKKAFNKTNHPTDDYVNLSLDIVNYLHGHPLALDVLGSHLCHADVVIWKSVLKSLKHSLGPVEKIMKVLRISYDVLKQNHKDIFLHIACFFKGKKKDRVMEILKSCDLCSTDEIKVLVGKSLITISDNRLGMHDLLQKMGWEIVREKHPTDHGKWSRLWLFKDVQRVLIGNTGTDKVKGIMLNYPQRNLRLNGEPFSRMRNLMLLKLSNVDVSGDQIWLPNNLRFLEWYGFPLKTLPSNFQAPNLFELNLCGSQINYLWKGMKDFPKLKTIKLSNSHNLIETPDFTLVPNLKLLDLEGCTRLHKVHDSVGLLERLTILNLKGIKNRVSFPSNVSGLKLLKILNLQGCSKLDRLPQNLGKLKVLEELDAGETAIRQVPPSIARLSKLGYLSFNGCKVQGRWSWFLPRKYLNSMCLSLPSLSGLFSLRTLDLNDCTLSEESLPSDLGTLCSLEELRLSNNNFVSLPDSIKRLSKLKSLCLENCRLLQSLPELPPEIVFVGIEDCVSLEDVSNILIGSRSMDFAIHLFNCSKLHENQASQNGLVTMLLKQRLQQPVDLSSQFHIQLPGSEIPRWFGCRSDGDSVEIGLPPNWFSDEFMGIAMCGVFAIDKDQDLNATLPMKMLCIMSIMGKAYQYWFTIPDFTTIKSNHLWLAFVPRAKLEQARSYQPSSFLDYSKKKELDPSYEEPDESDFFDFDRDRVSVSSSTCVHAEFIIGRAENSNSKVIECGIQLVYKGNIEFQDLPATEVSTSNQNHDCSKGHCWVEWCNMPVHYVFSNIRKYGVNNVISRRVYSWSDVRIKPYEVSEDFDEDPSGGEESITEGSLDGTEEDSGLEDFHEDPSGGNIDQNVNKGLWLLATAVRFFKCRGCCGME